RHTRAGVCPWIQLLLALVAALLAALSMPAAAQTFPKFTGFVVDDAGILPAAVQTDLTQKLDALQRDTKRQVVVVTV
ncbi:TPM domain-containing protein, partial [Escherichia coli]|uniref:TPM domain-containing protein n=1 Tax=Escherichia coli TaxID=562 RepID=UPI003D010792